MKKMFTHIITYERKFNKGEKWTTVHLRTTDDSANDHLKSLKGNVTVRNIFLKKITVDSNKKPVNP